MDEDSNIIPFSNLGCLPLVSSELGCSQHLSTLAFVAGHRDHLQVDEPGINHLQDEEAQQGHQDLHEQGGRLLDHQGVVDGQGFHRQQNG